MGADALVSSLEKITCAASPSPVAPLASGGFYGLDALRKVAQGGCTKQPSRSERPALSAATTTARPAARNAAAAGERDRLTDGAPQRSPADVPGRSAAGSLPEGGYHRRRPQAFSALQLHHPRRLPLPPAALDGCEGTFDPRAEAIPGRISLVGGQVGDHRPGFVPDRPGNQQGAGQRTGVETRAPARATASPDRCARSPPADTDRPASGSGPGGECAGRNADPDAGCAETASGHTGRSRSRPARTNRRAWRRLSGRAAASDADARLPADAPTRPSRRRGWRSRRREHGRPTPDHAPQPTRHAPSGSVARSASPPEGWYTAAPCWLRLCDTRRAAVLAECAFGRRRLRPRVSPHERATTTPQL